MKYIEGEADCERLPCKDILECNRAGMCMKKYREGFDPTLKHLTQEIAEWADSISPNRSPEGAFTKMLEEIKEWSERPCDGHEAADVMIMLLDVCHLAGIDIAKAVRWKMRINRNREWNVSEDGSFTHVRKDET